MPAEKIKYVGKLKRIFLFREWLISCRILPYWNQLDQQFSHQWYVISTPPWRYGVTKQEKWHRHLHLYPLQLPHIFYLFCRHFSPFPPLPPGGVDITYHWCENCWSSWFQYGRILQDINHSLNRKTQGRWIQYKDHGQKDHRNTKNVKL